MNIHAVYYGPNSTGLYSCCQTKYGLELIQSSLFHNNAFLKWIDDDIPWNA